MPFSLNITACNPLCSNHEFIVNRAHFKFNLKDSIRLYLFSIFCDKFILYLYTIAGCLKWITVFLTCTYMSRKGKSIFSVIVKAPVTGTTRRLACTYKNKYVLCRFFVEASRTEGLTWSTASRKVTIDARGCYVFYIYGQWVWPRNTLSRYAATHSCYTSDNPERCAARSLTIIIDARLERHHHHHQLGKLLSMSSPIINVISFGLLFIPLTWKRRG